MTSVSNHILARLTALTLTLVGCGGGEPAANEAPAVTAQSARSTQNKSAQASQAAQAATAAPRPLLDVDLLLNWAERAYPQFFPSHESNQESSPYTYRYYPATGNYVGVAGPDVYILGPFSGDVIQRVGSREDFRCSVTPSDCPAPTYARAGWVARLSSLQHGVSGTVTIVDERTLRLSGFHYDGGGPLVFAYLGANDSSAAYAAGRAIGPQLATAYANATVEMQLPEGQTLDGFTALSIWCAAFRVNFGSGEFKAPAAAQQ